MNTITMPITINGETREVEVSDDFSDGSRFTTRKPLGLYQKRPGQKTWEDSVMLWRQKDGTYKVGQTTTILNRAGYRLIGWKTGETRNKSQHNSAI